MSTRYVSVRIEVEIEADDDRAARTVATILAGKAKHAIETDPDVHAVRFASHVLRR
jgi:hypothetical protein